MREDLIKFLDSYGISKEEYTLIDNLSDGEIISFLKLLMIKSLFSIKTNPVDRNFLIGNLIKVIDIKGSYKVPDTLPDVFNFEEDKV